MCPVIGIKSKWLDFFRVNSPSSTGGYILPVTIMLGLGISTVNVLGMQVIAQNNVTLNNQYYTELAREAAQSGIVAAANCIKANNQTWSTKNVPLTPNTDCDGTIINDKPSTIINDETLQTSYSVGQLQPVGTSSKIVTSTGTVSIKGPLGVIVKKIPVTIRTYAKIAQAVTNRVSRSVSQMSVGDATACAVASGWVYCWGSNANGMLGSAKLLQGGYSDSPVAVASGPIAQQSAIPAKNGFPAVPARPATPANPMTLKTVTKVSVGTTHVCAVASGAAYCWGDNGYGQLGNSSYTDSDEPVAVTTASTPLDGKTIVDISAGNGFTCAVTSDGKVACWGYNSNGQLGYGDVTSIYVANYNRPVDTSNPNGRTAVFRGVTCFLIFCGPTPVAKAVPPSILATKNIVKLARSKSSSKTMCAIDNTGRAYCWGANDTGQVGDRNYSKSGTLSDTGGCGGGGNYPDVDFTDMFPDILQPVATQLVGPFDSFETYAGRTVAKTNSAASTPNRMYSWSDFRSSESKSRSRTICGSTGGQSGAGVNKYRHIYRVYYSASISIPAAPLYDNSVATTLNKKQLSLASGNAYNGLFCAMTGVDLYCDAHTTANYGQTGSNQPLTSGIPAGPQHVYMDGWLLGKTVLDIQVGGSFACVLTDQGIGCWGYNNVGQLGDNSTTNRNVPVAVDIDVTSDLGEYITSSSGAMFDNPIYF